MHRAIASSVVGAVLLLVPTVAHAEPTSWLAVGPAMAETYDYKLHGEGGVTLGMSAEIGVGSDASGPLVVGGVFRTLTSFEFGTDLSLAARIATPGFVRGYWGLALDLGVDARWWGHGAYGHYPFQPVAIFGLPRGGVQFEVGAQLGDVTGASPGAGGGFVLCAVDLFRLLSRRSNEQAGFWHVDSPAMTTKVYVHPASQ